jgi:putative flippase GtrA
LENGNSLRKYLYPVSLCGAAVDYIALFVIIWLTGNLLIAVVGARVLSSVVNFIINRLFVFNQTASQEKKGGKYPL